MAKLKDTQVDGNLSFTGELLNKDGVNLETAFSNLNLLINSDFRNPINQRGSTEYATSSAKHYTIDRWAASTGLKVTVNDNSIKLENTSSSDMYLAQKFEDYLPQDDYTLSCKVLSLTGEAWIYNYSDFKLQPGYNTKTLNNVSDLNSFTFGLTAGSKVELEWCKLEQGLIATPFVPRQRGEELALCQRYYIPYNGTSEHRVFIGGGHAEKTTEVYIQANIPSMRTFPTISYSDLRLLQVSGIPVTSMILRSYNDGKINLHCTVTGATATMYYTLAINKGGYLIFDAEIY